MPIDYKIERKRFEIIGDQIGAILARELHTQRTQFDVEEATAEVYRERTNTIDAGEGRVFNVQYASTDFESKHQANSTGVHTYFVDAYSVAEHKDDDRADEISSLQLQRMMGLVWEIFEYPGHNTLELAKPSIGGLHVSDMEILNARDGDNYLAITFGRVTIKVKGVETTQLPAGTAVLMSVAQVKIGLTENGFRYEYIEP